MRFRYQSDTGVKIRQNGVEVIQGSNQVSEVEFQVRHRSVKVSQNSVKVIKSSNEVSEGGSRSDTVGFRSDSNCCPNNKAFRNIVKIC